jgi:WD40 repeat protein
VSPIEKNKEGAKDTWKSAGILKHEHSVVCMAFGPDRYLLVSDEGVKLRAWEVGAKKQVPFNEGLERNPRTGRLEAIDYTKVNKDHCMAVAITYAADNSWVSFLARNGIHMAGPPHIKDGKAKSVGPGFSGDGMRPLAIASDGETHALLGTNPKTVRMIRWEHDWDRNSARQENGAVCKGHDEEPLCAAFSPDGSMLVTGSADKTVRIWEVASGNEKHVLRGHTNSILVVAFSPDGKQIVTGGKDGLVKLWDTKSGKERTSLKGHTVVRCLTFSPDGKTLVSGGEDEAVRIWDAATGREQAALRDHKGTVLTVAFSRDGKLLASGGTDKVIRLWEKK